MIAPVKYLTAHFEGYFMCRLATDPDPTNERRGRSGYTMALVSEDPLDQVIRLQADEYVHRHLRAPARSMGIEVGVKVRKVHFDGADWDGKPSCDGSPPWNGSPNLLGASVSLLGKDEMFSGPIFESRNNVVGSDDSLAFAIVPFQLGIDKTDEAGGSLVSVRALDHLNPALPEQAIWEMEDPTIYGRRLPTFFTPSSEEVREAIGVFDYYGYFRDRRTYLTDKIAMLEKELSETLAALPEGSPEAKIAKEQTARAVEEARSRIFQLEFWGERVLNKMGFQLRWDFEINGPQSVTGDLGGVADCTQPWPVSLWFGGWDGDLLVGYTRGSLSIPFRPG